MLHRQFASCATSGETSTEEASFHDDQSTNRQGPAAEHRARGDAAARTAAGLFPGRARRNQPDHASRRAGRTRRSATCAACSGPRSTTTIRAISTSSRLPNRPAGGAVKILVAIADVDALVKKGFRDRRPCADQHDLGLHRRRDLSDAAGKALDRPHFAGRGPGAAGDRDRDDGRRRRQRHALPTSTGPWSSIAPSWPTTRGRLARRHGAGAGQAGGGAGAR